MSNNESTNQTSAAWERLVEYVGNEDVLCQMAGSTTDDVKEAAKDAKNDIFHFTKSQCEAEQDVLECRKEILSNEIAINEINEDYERDIQLAKAKRDRRLEQATRTKKATEVEMNDIEKELQMFKSIVEEAQAEEKAAAYILSQPSGLKIFATESVESVSKIIGLEGGIRDILKEDEENLLAKFRALVNLDYASNPEIVAAGLSEELRMVDEEDLLDMQQRMARLLRCTESLVELMPLLIEPKNQSEQDRKLQAYKKLEAQRAKRDAGDISTSGEEEDGNDDHAIEPVSKKQREH